MRTIFLNHFGDQGFDHKGYESARYQPQQGGLEAFLDHFACQLHENHQTV